MTLTLTLTVAAHHPVSDATLFVGDRCLDILALATQPRPCAQLDFRSHLGLQYAGVQSGKDCYKGSASYIRPRPHARHLLRITLAK